MNQKLRDVRVAILVGGAGTRLRPVLSDRPKALAPVGNKTLLDYVLDNLLQQGFRDIVLCVGYMKEKVREHIGKRSFPEGTTISFSEEENPLGTGGAIKKALSGSPSEIVLVLNGDTLFPVDYGNFIKLHIEHNAHVSLCLKHMNDAGRFGTVHTDNDNKIVGFQEKTQKREPGVINCGVYAFNKNIFNNFNMPETFSIEKDFFEKHIHTVSAYGFTFPDYFIDIGTPEDYQKAQDDLKNKPEGNEQYHTDVA
ncbi:MAG: nucleotidyltransferase family protein [Candidatus Jorgensenbacteria bacterium]|nr:nucleotidyltransferase family protein [Candidatus Jorgensenbacteria bacterium]